MGRFLTIYCLATILLLFFIIIDLFCYINKKDVEVGKRLKNYVEAKMDVMFFLAGIIFSIGILLLLDFIFHIF